ncbi:nucleotide pyrophosphohydrolase [Candidatus Pacearchaeota archaeon]|nr:nucleotide pyrophosphohydrolase [Candidatus Pacearchaeota archaeon]
MSLEEIQKEVNDWANQFNPPYWPALEQMVRLTEEVGEVAREINHLYGTKRKKQDEAEKNVGQELVDVIFTVCCIANREKINLQQEWEKVMKEKLKSPTSSSIPQTSPL